MRIGLPPFLNTAPFQAIPYEITYAPPAALNAMMRQKELDVAFCSSIEYFEGKYERLPNLGLAAHGKILSVNLYLKGPLDGAHIRLDERSATSNMLLRILIEKRASIDELGNSFLLIGDDALHKQKIDGYETIDLAAWWFEKTGLPFVFALFIKQKGLDTKEIENALHQSLDQFGPQIDSLASEHNLPKKLLVEYFGLCHYKLGPADEKGLEYFHECQRDLFQHRS